MPVYRIRSASRPDGEFAAAWFDDARGRWDDDRLDRAAPLSSSWRPPRLRLHRPERGATEVLFNPNAWAVSDRVRLALSGFPELEFLPVGIARAGTFHVVHVIAALDPPPGCSFRRGTPAPGNIVEVFSFPATFEPEPAFFRLRQPPDSPAGRAGFCHSDVFANDRGANAIVRACGDALAAEELVPDRAPGR